MDFYRYENESEGELIYRICGYKDDAGYSWQEISDILKGAFEKAGYEVVPVVEGLGQLPEVQQLYVEHAKKAMEQK